MDEIGNMANDGGGVEVSGNSCVKGTLALSKEVEYI
jgi:hypothetical protein